MDNFCISLMRVVSCRNATCCLDTSRPSEIGPGGLLQSKRYVVEHPVRIDTYSSTFTFVFNVLAHFFVFYST